MIDFFRFFCNFFAKQHFTAFCNLRLPFLVHVFSAFAGNRHFAVFWLLVCVCVRGIAFSRILVRLFNRECQKSRFSVVLHFVFDDFAENTSFRNLIVAVFGGSPKNPIFAFFPGKKAKSAKT